MLSRLNDRFYGPLRVRVVFSVPSLALGFCAMNGRRMTTFGRLRHWGSRLSGCWESDSNDRTFSRYRCGTCAINRTAIQLRTRSAT
jgi:hypothetical protein